MEAQENLNNQQDTVISDPLLEAFKNEFGPAKESESSLTTETEESQTQEVNETLSETTIQTNKDEGNTSEPETQEVSTEISETPTIDPEEYKTLKEQLEELQKYKEEAESKTTEVDLSWFKSEEGQLWQRDLENVDLEDSWDTLLVEKLVKEKGFTLAEAQEEIQDLYPELFDEEIDEDSREFKSASRKVLVEARGYLEQLKERQKGIEVPVNKVDKPNTPQEGQIAKEEFDKIYNERLTQSYQERVQSRTQIAENLLKGKQKINMSLGDTNVEYELKPEVVSKIKQDLAHLESIGQQFVDQDAQKIKDSELLEFLIFKNDRQTLLDIYAGHKVAEAKKQTINTELKNTNFNPKTPKAGKTEISEDDPQYAIIKGLANGEY